jgi:hypothetical protein
MKNIYISLASLLLLFILVGVFNIQSEWLLLLIIFPVYTFITMTIDAFKDFKRKS